MKKISLFFSSVVCFGFALQAQKVGINVTAPSENLHVDSTIKVGKNSTLGTLGRKNLVKFGDDNYVTIGEEIADDKMYIRYGDLVFFPSGGSGNGRIGVKIETPSADLDVNGTVRLRVAGAAAGNVLTSDANGNATWQAPTGGNDIYSLGSVDFKAASSDVPISVSGGNGGAYFTTAYNGNLVAPVHLPNGVKVTQIKVFYIDNSAAENINFVFYGEYVSIGGYNSFATTTTSGASSAYRTAIITPSTPITIDNTTYGYQFNGFAQWAGNTTMLVKGVQFTYTN